jgi:hypothetical protein
VTVGELLPDQSVPLLKRRLQLSREEAIKPGLRRRNRAGRAQRLNGIRPSCRQLIEIKHLKPGDEFEIKQGRNQIQLIPLGVAEDE